MKNLRKIAMLLVMVLVLSLFGGLTATAETTERLGLRYDFDQTMGRTTADAILLLRHVDGWDDGMIAELEGDVSGDGKVSVYDVVCFLKLLMNDTFDMEKALKVATYNIKAGYYYYNTLPKIAALLKDLDADIVGLQEVDLNTGRSGTGDQMKYLAETAGYKYYYFTPVVSLTNTHTPATAEQIAAQYNLYGHGILSKYPIKSYDVIYPENQVTDGEVRAIDRYEVKVGSKILTVYNGHLAGTLANAQYSEVQNDYMVHDQYAIFMGDMNAVPKKLTDLNAERFELLTDYDPYDTTPIDHLIVSNDTISWYSDTVGKVENVTAFTVESYPIDEPFEFTTSSGVTYTVAKASDHNLRYAYIMLKDY